MAGQHLIHEWMQKQQREKLDCCLSHQIAAEELYYQQRDPSSLELSSYYWCALLQEASFCVKKVLTEMEEGSIGFSDLLKNKLLEAKSFLEERIGRNLNELDDYLRSYRLDP